MINPTASRTKQNMLILYFSMFINSIANSKVNMMLFTLRLYDLFNPICFILFILDSIKLQEFFEFRYSLAYSVFRVIIHSL